jgi:hypothetical protein
MSKNKVVEKSGWWRRDIPRPAQRADGFPTRNDMSWFTVAELAITEAMLAVEQTGASAKLTEAVTLLAKARAAVADHVEGDRDRPPSRPQRFTTTVVGVGPFCVEFADGEIITTRNSERQNAIADLVR